MDKIIIGTRGSKLALWQAHWVRDQLARLRPGLSVEVQIIKTEGDKRHDLPPESFGREGIFTAELDRALLESRIDIAVHSLKDLPTGLGEGLALAAVTERGPVADTFILRKDHARELGAVENPPAPRILDNLDKKIVVGTSSLRRIALLKHRFPNLECAPMRGNLDTRMKKLTDKEVDAVVVARAGLVRLDIQPDGHLMIPLPPDDFLPAAGQGALGIESRDNDPALEVAAVLDHKSTRACVTAERTAMSALGAGCRVPAGFLARQTDENLNLQGVVAHPRGEPFMRAEVEGPATDPDGLGRSLSDKLLAMGAKEVLDEVRA